tara:strand:- start:298 stop:1749 length:1452 start_codon:yes stop_codon:yes gene_type:complete
MIECYTAQACKEIDKAALKLEKNNNALMENAGQALWEVLQSKWPDIASVGILVGTGNNGGDGYVLARLAAQAGVKVSLFATGAPKGQASEAFTAFENSGGKIEDDLDTLLKADLIIDALLGTGLNAPIEGKMAEIIQQVNEANKPILAVDIPTGLCADTGARLGHAVNADVTVTFIVNKPGLFTAFGPDHCGQIIYHSLGVAPTVYSAIEPIAHCVKYSQIKHWTHPRKPSTHKGACGHVVVIGGSIGMTGAAVLSAMAALRVGAGKVTIATHPEHAGWLNLNYPEIMTVALHSTECLDEVCAQADIMVLGPGLGKTQWAKQLFLASMNKSLPKVLDADALNWMAELGVEKNEMHILTPHPAEAARLLKRTTRELQNNRFAAIGELVNSSGSTIVLKGCGSLIASPNLKSHICTQGNPGMATAGMGDVLSGTIAGLWGQGMTPEKAAVLGTCLHAKAGDMAALNGERGMIASDLMPFMRALLG